MPVEAVAAAASGAAGVTQTGYLADPAGATGARASGADAVNPAGATGFAQALAGAVDGAQALQGESKQLAMRAITGDLTDIHQATLASSRAAVTLELVAAVRNRGVEAFNEIMRMQA
ncbi:flagellar hook-basal body complex protein FliE [Agromyces sp. G08B096]|uniref:Flagellar hook-basal body complex protein FliE n=1 Tax=Agromyces sp. G08B096 TaxID=3156399 RepID=A0AAU7W731_9MICO